MISAEGVGKRYKLGSIGPGSLRAAFEGWFGRDDAAKGGGAKGDFWSLRDVSFTVQPGEVVGLVGRNGAGKSTLLKVLSRITEPTTGRIRLRGRVASLLEVGTGFHPELTGRENIFLNGAILGMKRWEIAAKFNEIIEFAEIGPFLDTPVKRYSSGMFVRLAFAVAAHLEPEILLIDEVLAVGDAAFQKKCLGKMDEVAHRHGRTVFFVSHNLGAVRSLCSTALLLQQGRLVLRGTPAEVIAHYLSSAIPDQGDAGGHVEWTVEKPGPGNEELRFRSVTLRNESGDVVSSFDPGQPVEIGICYDVATRLRNIRTYFIVRTAEGEEAFAATDHLHQPETVSPGRYRTIFTIPGGILNRRGYILSAGCDIPGERTLVPEKELLRFSVCGAGNQSCIYPEDWPGTVCPRVPCKVERVDDRETPVRST